MQLTMVVAGGGQLTRRQHLLSRDGRMLLVCTANTVRVYGSATGERLFDLQGHTDEVTDLCLHPGISSQVYSSSRDGTISLWDLQSGVRVQSWPVIGESIEGIRVVNAMAFLTCSWREAQAGRALAFDLIKGIALESRTKLSKPRTLALSLGGSLIATHDRHTVLVWSPAHFGSVAPLALHHTKAITCVAISPDGARLAAGDVTGRIVIWHDVATTVARRVAEAQAPAQADQPTTHEPVEWQEPPAATVHWHAHAVGCLAFSVDGTYLLSGGHEAVLVIWDAVSGRRAYLPRLGGPLVGIVGCEGDPARYAVRQSDNTLRVINTATMTVESSIHGLRPLPRGGMTGPGVSPPFAIQPKTGLAVLTGPHAVLQWYDFVRDMHVNKLQLSPRNIVSLTEADAVAMGGVYGPPSEPAATAVVFSQDGATMATVESRPDPAGGGSVQYALKFWDRAPPGEAQYGSPYLLNTLADQPHRSTSGFGGVTSLAFHPTADIAVTTSDTGEFKIWTRQALRSLSSAGVPITQSTWRCGAVGTHRDEPLTASSFSSDGSLLALGSVYGGISLWDATQTALIGVLPPAVQRPIESGVGALPVRQLFFLSDSPFLIASLVGGLALYNLLTMRCEWAAEVEVGAIAVDPSSLHWAALLSDTASNSKSTAHVKGTTAPERDRGLVVFQGANEVPVGAWRVQRAGGPEGISVAFVPRGTPLYVAAEDTGVTLPGCSPLVVLTTNREYAVAWTQKSKKVPSSGEARTVSTALGSEKLSTFEAMYGKSARAEVQEQEEGGATQLVSDIGRGKPNWSALFDAPSHALPPMTTLCPAFLELVVMGGQDKGQTS